MIEVASTGMPLRGREEDESVFFVHYPLFRATFEGSSHYSTLHHETFQRHHQRRHPSFIGKSTPLPANTRVLARPQSAQRRLLCLGKTPDARDLAALRGPVPPQRSQTHT